MKIKNDIFPQAAILFQNFGGVAFCSFIIYQWIIFQKQLLKYDTIVYVGASKGKSYIPL